MSTGEQFGSWLRAVRRQGGLSRIDLADIVGARAAHVQRAETEMRKRREQRQNPERPSPLVSTAVRMFVGCGVPTGIFDELFASDVPARRAHWLREFIKCRHPGPSILVTGAYLWEVSDSVARKRLYCEDGRLITPDQMRAIIGGPSHWRRREIGRITLPAIQQEAAE